MAIHRIIRSFTHTETSNFITLVQSNDIGIPEECFMNCLANVMQEEPAAASSAKATAKSDALATAAALEMAQARVP